MGRRIYTVHAPGWSPAADADAVLVPEGFNWAAFFFGPLWALWHGMWRTAIALLVISLGLSGAVFAAGMTDAVDMTLSIAVQVAIGLWANDWRRYALARRDYRERAVVSGRNLADAEAHYFAGRA
ncbi:MAG: DUF2628 domain-containing protein [Alphaproteobacteria bacterium]